MALKDQDITTLDKYRRRVQTFEFRYPSLTIDAFVLHTLKDCYNDVLFPNLRELNLKYVHDVALPFIQVLLSRNLTSFTFICWQLDPKLIDFICSLPTQLSSDTIRRVHIMFESDQDLPQLRSFSADIGIWHSLCHLSLSGTTPEDLVQIAKLPRLTKLGLTVQAHSSWITPDPLGSIPDPFPCLSSLTISDSLPSRASKVFSYVLLSHLEEFHMHNEQPGSAAQQDWIGRMLPLAQHLSVGVLKKFHVNCPELEPPEDWLNVILAPLLQFPLLEDVKIVLSEKIGLYMKKVRPKLLKRGQRSRS